jgi:predicted NAD-dependent protein-ADP-ribosyltransferase YbiA (DUF1768 family)
MAAKMRTRTYRDRMTVAARSAQDVDNMRMVLQLKLRTHPLLGDLLSHTADAMIIEDCTRRSRGSGLFWGAALVNGEWQGANVLGKLWMALRDRANEERQH